MSNYSTFLIVVFLPFLAALGHDGYLFFTQENADMILNDVLAQDRPVQSLFASFGYVWTTYLLPSYNAVKQNVSEDQWSLISKALPYKVSIVTFVFGIVCLVIKVTLDKAGVLSPQSTGDKSFGSSKGKGGKAKYKRK